MRLLKGLWLAAVLLCACNELGEGECQDACWSLGFAIGFSDASGLRIDTLAQDSLRVDVVAVSDEAAAGKAALQDCVECQERFLNPSLVSDHAVRTPAGDTLPPGTNLLEDGVVSQVGVGGRSSLTLFRATRLQPGNNTFTYAAFLDGEEITATGSLQVPDSLGF